MNRPGNFSKPARRPTDGWAGAATAPAQRYAALALVASVAVAFFFALRGWGLLVPGLGLSLSLLGIFARWRLAPPLFLAWVLIVLFAQGQASRWHPRVVSQGAAGLVDALFATAVMVFLIAVTRLHALEVRIFPAPPDSRYFWTRMWDRLRRSARPSGHARDPNSCTALEQATVPLWAAIWWLAAGLVTAILPTGGALARYYGLDALSGRAVVTAWLLVLAPAVASAGFAYARWRQLSRPEAGVYLRSVFWRFSSKEQQAIARYAAKRRRRRRKR